MIVSRLLVDLPAGRGLWPEIFAVLALAVLIYGLRDAWRGVRQWLSGEDGQPHEQAAEGGSAAEAESQIERLAQGVRSEAAPPVKPAAPSAANASAAARAAAVIARALTEAQIIISAGQAPGEQSSGAAVADDLGRCEATVARLADRTDQLSLRVAALSEAVAALATHAHATPSGAATAPTPVGPSFEPDAEGIDLIVAGTPGFQGLMDIQHALARLPQARSASVRRYEHDEAEFHLVLAQAMTAAAIAEAVHVGSDRQPLIEAAAPEARRLRLRLADA
jgi:hypothetical protein